MPPSARLRAFFHWQYSQFAIGLVLSTGVALALSSQFTAAYVFLALAGAWAIGFWLNSEFLREREAHSQAFRRNRHTRLHAKRRRQFFAWKWGITTLLAGLALFLVFWTRQRELQTELAKLNGLLIPASDPTPANSCTNAGATPDAYLVFLGNSTSVVRTFPHVVVGAGNSYSYKPILSLSKDPRGRIGINFDIYDFEGNDPQLIARVQDSRFTVNPNAVFHFDRPDFSSLKIVDRYGTEVLNVRYMNPRAISLSAKIGHEVIQSFIDGRNRLCVYGGNTSVDLLVNP